MARDFADGRSLFGGAAIQLAAAPYSSQHTIGSGLVMQYLVAYAASAVVFLGLDLLWLGGVARSFYRSQLGPLLRDQPDLAVAGLFYAVYVGGVVLFAVGPALQHGSWVMALLLGAALGAIAYGTYDLTNLATLRGWPATLSAVDLLWGSTLTGLSATAGYLAARWAGGGGL